MESVPVASVIRVLSLHHHPPGNPFPMKSTETLAFSGASLHNSLEPWSRRAFPSNFGLLRRKVPVRRPEVPRPALAPLSHRFPRSGKKMWKTARRNSTPHFLVLATKTKSELLIQDQVDPKSSKKCQIICPTKTTQTPKKSVKVSNGTRYEELRLALWLQLGLPGAQLRLEVGVLLLATARREATQKTWDRF